MRQHDCGRTPLRQLPELRHQPGAGPRRLVVWKEMRREDSHPKTLVLGSPEYRHSAQAGSRFRSASKALHPGDTLTAHALLGEGLGCPTRATPPLRRPTGLHGERTPFVRALETSGRAWHPGDMRAAHETQENPLLAIATRIASSIARPLPSGENRSRTMARAACPNRRRSFLSCRSALTSRANPCSSRATRQ